MPVNLELHESQQYIIYRISEPWTINDLVSAYHDEREIRDSIPHTLHSITDISGVKSIPRNWLQAKVGPGFKHPRSGLMLMAGQNTAIKMIVDVLLRIVRYDRMKMFKTLEEAQAFLDEYIAEQNEKPVTQARR